MGKAEEFIKGLCQQKPNERLPMKKGGIENIKKHGYFEGFSWKDAEELKMTPPYKPAVKSKKDIANFSARKEDMPPQVPYKDDNSGWDKFCCKHLRADNERSPMPKAWERSSVNVVVFCLLHWSDFLYLLSNLRCRSSVGLVGGSIFATFLGSKFMVTLHCWWRGSA